MTTRLTVIKMNDLDLCLEVV